MARKKIKLEKRAIAEILVADTKLESGAEANDIEDCFEEEEEEQVQQQQQQKQKQQQQASAKVEPQAAPSGGLPTWGSIQRTQIFIISLVQQRV
jgi:hypothetical protein